jgi:carbamoyltransferase
MSEVKTGLPMKTGYVAGIARGHNGGVCLLKDGKVVFSIEEERLSRRKYDGGPYASLVKILEYTDKIDYLVVAHTQTLEDTAGRVDFSGDDVYTGLARKLGLIERNHFGRNHPQVIDLSFMHHKLHAACAFYRSGWEDAAALIVDGAGTFIGMNVSNQPITVWEVESIIDCSYPSNFTTMYKHYGTREPVPGALTRLPSDMFGEQGKTHEALLTDRAGIVKVYEAVTEYCGWSSIEAGKTMGLFPYGEKNDAFPKLFDDSTIVPLSNRNLIVPTYPNGAKVNAELFDYLKTAESCSTEDCDDCSCGPKEDVTLLQNRRDLAYACQTQTQEQVVRLIRKAAEITGKKRVVISGGYGLNCVANYHYLEALKDDGIEIYCEPVSNDAGTAIGAAMMFYKGIMNDATIEPRAETLYLGPRYDYTNDQIEQIASKYDAKVVDANHADIVNLLISKNIVAQFQGRSENGPRALGNRSFLFDPRFADGKDFVNGVKHREYFRPFAGSILEEHVHEWFDLRGMESSPTMMYAVNCQPGIEDKIPSIIHVDGTCRIQTVNVEQNKHYYELIKEFYNKTGCPIVFNTSFNLGGDPLVETLEDAVATLAKSEVEYLYLPEYGKLIKVSNYED